MTVFYRIHYISVVSGGDTLYYLRSEPVDRPVFFMRIERQKLRSIDPLGQRIDYSDIKILLTNGYGRRDLRVDESVALASIALSTRLDISEHSDVSLNGSTGVTFMLYENFSPRDSAFAFSTFIMVFTVLFPQSIYDNGFNILPPISATYFFRSS